MFFLNLFFLNLSPWDYDLNGTAIQVLRLGITTMLTLCENRGFGSVALPVVGAGIALRFPDSVVARVLLEQVHAFERSRVSRTPFLFRIVIHPKDKETSEVFKSVQEAFQHEGFTQENDQPGQQRSEEQPEPEIVRSITECARASGPHVFLIVLKVEKFTEHEQAVISEISRYFSENVLKYAVIVFTHGDELSEGMKIEEFVSQNKNLSDLVKKCSGRCHVIDNKRWKNRQQNEYRSNLFQVEELLNTIDKMVIGKQWRLLYQ
ncbi:hypothetical protein L3Q82_004009 [Scortum barcoo]|uniref:Uncharacterized protein n=1 Tax=Scortum barcoo TaxID=214431 RepID=A0ACB8X7J2_9TELE|nr:hypothetical protein L3Q82_004009 [Scortum barcoo]